MIPRATYRFQFHRDFTFAAAQDLVPYLDDLGVSHVYASPITTARGGSMHGYDVVDPTRVNPELGGEEGLRALVAALRGRGMGLIIDIVPNHMGVAGGENVWWNDVLKHGEDSAYARFFDIDWRRPILLPVLGAPLDQALAQGDIVIERGDGEAMLVAYGEHRFPIRPEDQRRLPIGDDKAGLTALLGRQHYRLGWWRTADDELNWRRFFTVNDLAGLRIEDPQVFEHTHELYFRLWREGLIDGVRIDHVDGLTDPAGYCRTLRARFDAMADERNGERAWIVVEKILGPGESLSTDWGLDGTSGYDFMEEASALLHDERGKAELEQLWHHVCGCDDAFSAYELRARQDMLLWAFDAQFRGCVEAFSALAATAPEWAGLTRGMLSRAVTRLLWSFPVYRTYGTGSAAPPQDERVREIARAGADHFTPPGEQGVSDQILAWLAGDGPGDPGLAAEAVRRFQQLSAPIAAKSVEDTAFYRYGLLLSRTDVGFDASRFSAEVDDFHRWCAQRAQTFPHAMLATATHDHKRGEDMRARLAVLSGIPDHWRDQFEDWDRQACHGLGGDAIHPVDRYFIFQTGFGAWPPDLPADDVTALARFADRLVDWNMKSLREAKQRSSWEQPDSGYEERCARYIRTLLASDRGSAFLASMAAFVANTSAAATANSLAQTALRCLAPGVPDLYQGAEGWDFSLVDPDNRRPVDFEARKRALQVGAADCPKLAMIRRLLGLRRSHPGLFRDGTYEPLPVSGARRAHVLAFRRRRGGDAKVFAVAVKLARPLWRSDTIVPPAQWWEDTCIAISDNAQLGAAEAFAHWPVHDANG